MLGVSLIVAAAKLLDEKLQHRERAEQLLWQQWPYGQQVLDSTILAFTWLAEGERHTEVLERFQAVSALASNPIQQTLLAR